MSWREYKKGQTFSVPIEKEVTNVDKDGNKNVVTISYKSQKIKCKENCDCFLEYESLKNNLIKYKCLSCNKDYSNKIDEELKN